MIHEAGTLIKNPAAPDGIVPDLAVAHVTIRGHTHRCSMGFEAGGQAVVFQPVQCRRICPANDITVFIFSDADPIQDGQHHRALRAGEGFAFFQRFHDKLLRAKVISKSGFR